MFISTIQGFIAPWKMSIVIQTEKKEMFQMFFFQLFKSFDTIGISHLLKKTEYTAVDGISN